MESWSDGGLNNSSTPILQHSFPRFGGRLYLSSVEHKKTSRRMPQGIGGSVALGKGVLE